ncbi:hypothetical protein PHYPO_G00054860 [Pangasianodon hypophthalmus]|uniref:Ig-like domain-containing protein n=1 Tax=Pangasianodon hypophthalmus TaxID=310915 RepID=A0A5N5M677_PANHP|nr:hypothetical protein PHYPO_G00054860 [Pangasianodon hypophthalmus]
MKRLLLLDIILYGILFNNTWAWSVSMPSSIHGLHKSCLVIPCSFNYSSYPPHNPYRVVWYQYVSRGYPVVYDGWNPSSVIDMYRGRTSLYKGTYRDCSLLIEDLSFSHDKDRIYTWIDPENVGWRTYEFYHVTTLIHVDSKAPKPSVEILEGYRIGDSITVRCQTYHTCPYKPPSLSLTGIEKKFGTEDRLEHSNTFYNGVWTITLTRQGIVQSERQEVKCSVRHTGGLTEFSTKIHNAECSINQARITPDSNTEFLEGVEQDIICSVTYMCFKDKPEILWNGGKLSGRIVHERKQGVKYEARSTLKFTAKADDHGKIITCQRKFKGTVQTVQITLKVKKSMGSLDWSFTMPSKITGVRGSCVVIPCNYEFKNSQISHANVKWYTLSTPRYSLVYDQSTNNIINEFKGKTSLFGSSVDKNCSLKIQPLEMQHSQKRLFPWMDPNSIESYHSKNFDGVTIILEVTDIVEKPQAELLGIAKVGEPVTLSCSVVHNCPSPPPTLSLSISRGTQHLTNTPLHHGKWKATKEITWTVEENDNSVTCTVTYTGGQTSKTEISLNPLCPIDQVKITTDSNTEFLEGVEQDIVCFVTYTCAKDRPYINLIGEQLPGSTSYITKQGTKQIAKSTLKFTPKASDHGKTITCLADFKGNVQTVEITLRVRRSMGSLDWSFTMPSTITGIRGSCVVIPCNYEFKNPQSSHADVKWYKLSATGYQLVYDQSTNKIINRFKGKTSLFGSSNDKNCSLKIQPLEMQHSQERLFPWMDSNSIESYHSKNFDHVTIVLEVTDIVEKPQAELLGIAKVGEPVTLSCSVVHTCPLTPPTLSLSISHGTQHLIHTPLHDGKWKTTREITWTVEENDKSVTCTVSYTGGQTSKTEISLNPLCDFDKPVISPTEDEAMEGIEKSFTCTVNYTCQKKKPNIIWNYQNMPVSVETHKVSSHSWKTVSTLKLKASRDDHGKILTCTAQTTEGETSDHITLKVKMGMSSLDWTYSMPSKITGIRGSCVVIPCSFDFRTEKLRNVVVKWYLYSTTKYPLVYDADNNEVTGKYFGKARLYGLPSEKNCSLEIKQLDMHHNGDRLYPWMDPKPVMTFHKENYYDKSVELQIKEQADKPKLSITGIPRVGEQITVSCSVQYTCPSNPPSLSMGKALETDITVHTPVQDGFWEIIRVHTFIIKEEKQTVTCKATFHGGQTSEAQLNLNAQCTYKDITIDPEVADVAEGVGKNFTCTVFHSCKGQTPKFTWNYKDVPETVGTKKGPSLTWATYSNILYIASMEDDGKKLTCTATLPGGEITTSIVLQVQRYVPKVVDPFENDTFHVLEANVVPRITALTRSCVVIPCTFQTGNEMIMSLRGLWYTTTGEYVYHSGKSNVMDNFKGRTQLLGNPDEQNCTLEIDNVQAHDNGPFCFRAEKGDNKYGFNHSCVFIIMKGSPDSPVISAPPGEMEPGKRFTINCSVTHTCSSHPPTITWNVPATREVVSHVERSTGKWETISTITFIPTGYEEEENLVCRASFWRGKSQESSTFLSVKRFEGLGMDIIGLYIILPLLSLLLLCIAAGIIIRRRRVQKKTSDNPTPEKRRSIWGQISRRYGGAASWLSSTTETSSPPRPPKPEKRRSIWSRFSRRGPVNSTDLTVQYNVSATATSAGYSKPHYPSPKSEPKSYKARGGHLAHYDENDYTSAANIKMHRKM